MQGSLTKISSHIHKMSSFLYFPCEVNLVTPHCKRVKLLRFAAIFFFLMVPTKPHNLVNLKSCSLPSLLTDSAAVGCCSTCYELQSNFIVVQLFGDRNRCLQGNSTPNLNAGWFEVWLVIVGSISTLQIVEKADSHWIKITDVLHSYYQLSELHR